MISRIIISVATLLWLLATPAYAALLQYRINGVDTNSQNQIEYASFEIDSDRVPDGSAPGIGFFVAAVKGVFRYGTSITYEPQDITFYLDAEHGYNDPGGLPGGLFVGAGDLLGFNGPQLFTGPIDHPTLRTGNFTIFDEFSGSPISLSVEAVPEAGTWIMMLSGFLVVGLMVRRSRSNAIA